ncbi:GGDEF domain-containing protein [Allohahella marinimesophila]|uniref:GGDEF domain-containing protein n=1 Tax=Allohahella marinimesophila TaxID=1054972 RepID=UPI0031D02445
MSSDQNQWKNKYNELLAQWDEKEGKASEMISIMQRLVTRVSLAAEGQNRSLDSDLKELRSLLRATGTSPRQLTQQLERIEKRVLELDEARNASIEVLGEMAQLVERRAGGDAAPVADGAPVEERRSRKPSLFGRLLAGLSSDTKQAAPVSAKPASITRKSSASGSSFDSLPPGMLSTDLDATPSTPGLSAFGEHVQKTLLHLLSSMTLPDSAVRDLEKAREKILAGASDSELMLLLDEVAALVIAALGKGQRDFETFLRSLDDRLSGIHAFITEAHKHQEEALGSKQSFRKAIKDQVSTIQSDVAEADSLSHLQASVRTHLDSLITSLDAFVEHEDQREQTLLSSLASLKVKTAELESQTAELKIRLKEERNRALTDGLTGVPNREAFETRILEEFERWSRYRNPLTVAVCDIDLFKRINDSYGHLAGDRVIQIVAKELAKRLRRTDFFARYGGEEFVIIFPETKLEAAEVALEKMRKVVSELPFHFRGEQVQVTVSFGVTEFTEGDTRQSAFDRADGAMYSAKDNGRNAVVAAS